MTFSKKIPPGLLAGLLLGAALGAGSLFLIRGGPGTPPDPGGHGGHDEGGHAPGVVELPREQWIPAGLRVEPAEEGDLTLVRAVTGSVSANEDRLAHVYPVVEGIAHEVYVRFGDRVERGDELALIDSREVGQAKLALVVARQGVRIASVNDEWAATIHRNVKDLIEVLDGEPPVQEVVGRFEGRPMGEYRSQLLSSYARFVQARTEFDRDAELNRRDALSEKAYLQTKAEFETALAEYKAVMEQAAFTSEQHRLQSQQALEQARVAEGSARSALMILGYDEAEVDAMDPLGEGEEVAHATVTAPFSGTITEKDVVIEERVGPQKKLFDLADLSTVWVRADIYEKDLPLLAGLQGRTIRFRTESYPDRDFEAEVFYTGDLVDPSTRTVRLVAEADNADGLLKPGQFATVELPVGVAGGVLRVPESALQEGGGESYLFVHLGGDRFERRDVATGRRVPGEAVEVIGGLRPGEPVVVSGAFALKSAMLLDASGEAGHAH
ncbi:efflux RND transporter periplasmic adaptor subunit [Tautonia plasticadhaerens]|uniref:Cobalt-zinc-cadmium resistance protein CzcB n=1 Tax=Tautonia plasticadhaerens TaxID=2527974 RepID=A0A518GZT2_9BACT|nr:efflux RND transporter periplasmic adaptor subunit [Tautonia plasticadhaerens]QDV34084.1 Cobalt-zinc-cadmium resistance protein CzcB [Tautonia plasticadhaerens]